MMPSIIGIIPARYASTRFPGKPLAKIQGKTLIQSTYENALRCDTLEKLIIATDDQRIYAHALSFGAEIVMTSETCLLIAAGKQQHYNPASAYYKHGGCMDTKLLPYSFTKNVSM